MCQFQTNAKILWSKPNKTTTKTSKTIKCSSEFDICIVQYITRTSHGMIYKTKTVKIKKKLLKDGLTSTCTCKCTLS